MATYENKTKYLHSCSYVTQFLVNYFRFLHFISAGHSFVVADWLTSVHQGALAALLAVTFTIRKLHIKTKLKKIQFKWNFFHHLSHSQQNSHVVVGQFTVLFAH